MNQSETTGKLADALAKAQAEMKNAPLNKVNPHFKSKYADLAAIRDACMPALCKHGLSVTQVTGMVEGQFVLRTRLMHSSGEWVESVYPLPLDIGKPQAMGSAITYARRYCLAALAGLSAEEDDDANAAQGAGNATPAPRPTPTANVRRGNPQDIRQQQAPQAAPDLLQTYLKQIQGQNTEADLKAWKSRHLEEIKAQLSDQEREALNSAYAEKLSKLPLEEAA